MARKFLYLVAAIITLVLAAGVAWQLWPVQIVRLAFEPSVAFKPLLARSADNYRDAALWLARPDIAESPSKWTPNELVDAAAIPGSKAESQAAIFYVHPTSFLDRRAWNAPVDDASANDMAANQVRGQASALANLGDIWAPRYRQATFGAFFSQKPERKQAFEAAYRDIVAAFDRFLADAPQDQPIILAGHSQGTMHLVRLMHERVAGKPIAKRIAVAYLVGWPISVSEDIPQLGLPACANAESSNCVMSWQSFAEPADTRSVDDAFDGEAGLSGKTRKGNAMLCTRPMSGTGDSRTKATQKLGYLRLSTQLAPLGWVDGSVRSACTGRGYLMIDNPPDLGDSMLPGNNYHIYDWALFWLAIERDATMRLGQFSHQ